MYYLCLRFLFCIFCQLVQVFLCVQVFNVLMELFINQKKKKISASSFEYFIDLYLNKSLGIYYEYVSLIYLLLLRIIT